MKRQARARQQSRMTSIPSADSKPSEVRPQSPAGLSADVVQLDSSPLLILSFPVPTDDVLASLSVAEREVALLIASGKTNSDIAHMRGVSKNTIAKQVAAVLRKTRATSRFELIAFLSGARHISSAH